MSFKRLGNVLSNLIDDFTAENINYNKATTFFDGSAMDDSKTDGVIYIKEGSEYFLDAAFQNSKEVNIKRYGLPGDGAFHTIASLFPNITLSEVQSYDATANLNSSADWFIISKLLKILPIQSTILLQGSFVIDREIIIKRGFFEIKGINSGKTDKFLNHKAKIIQQGNGKDVFKVIDGDGTTYGYGVGQIQHVYFENFIIQGTMTAANQSGNGIAFYLSPEGTTGTAIGFYFKKMQVRSCLNGFKHFTGHINDFFFDKCEFTQNFNAGFVTSGNPQNQPNYFTFKDTGFNANGYKVVSGNVVDFVQDGGAPNYTKGGFISLQVVSFTFIGVNAQSNKGFGFDFGDAAHLGVFLNGYAENNTLGDLRVLKDTSYNREFSVSGFYSRDETYVFEDAEVQRRAFSASGANLFTSEGDDVYSNNEGNFGIGTTPDFLPTEKLDVRSENANTSIRTGFYSSTNGIRLTWLNDNGRGEVMVDGNYEMRLGMTGKRVMSLRPNYGVVIGENPVALYTAVPDNSLLVQGSIIASQFFLSDLNTAPASATAPGVKGEKRTALVGGVLYDFVCIDTNTWVRSAAYTTF